MNARLHRTPLSVAIALLLVAPVTESATFVVNTTADAVVADGQVSLREAVLAASSNAPVNADAGAGDPDGDTIRFDAIVFAPANNAEIILTQGALAITDDLGIDALSGGVDVSVSGNNLSRVFTVDTSESVRISGLLMTEGSAGVGTTNNGGAIRVGTGGNLTLSTCVVSFSTASAGGGLEVSDARVTIQNGVIGGNSAAINGGAIHTSGNSTVTLLNSFLLLNTAGQEGGALWNGSASRMLVTSSQLVSNTAQIANASNDAQGGGAVFNNGGTITIQNSQLSGNTVAGAGGGADDGGGALFNDGRNSPGARIELTGLTVISSNLALSTSLNGGGGLNIGANNGAEIVAGVGVRIESNQAARAGGGLESNNGVLSLSGVEISGNSAGVNGGGIHVTSADQTTLTNATISGNTAGQEGGGLWNSATGTMQIHNAIISGNSALIANAAVDAQGGGGVFNNGGAVSINDTLISGNTVTGATGGADDGGGGIFNDGRNTTGATITLTGLSTISDNVALSTSLNGGGGLNIGSANSNAVISLGSGVTVSGNHAARAGGGLEGNNGTLSLTGVELSGNSAGVNGGGLHVTGADQTTLTNTTISGNTAGQEGGGLWNSSTGTMQIDNAIISGNSALIANAAGDAQGGGGVFNNGGMVSINDTLISGNTVTGATGGADDGGGGIFNDGRNTSNATIILTGLSTISDNVALSTSLNGGGGLNIGDFDSSPEINAGSGVWIRRNRAARAGGGLESNNGVLVLDGVLLASNSAGINGGGLHTTGADQVSISNSTISGNTAGQEGGGLWNSATGAMQIAASTISSNTALAGNAADAQGGGGLFNNGGTLGVVGSSIDSNLVQGTLDATDGGGGIFNDARNTDGATVSLSDTVLNNNRVVHTGAGLLGRGGAVLTISDFSNESMLEINGGRISANQAPQAGGAIEVRALDSNAQGDSLSRVMLSGALVQGNVTANNGGAVHQASVTSRTDVSISNARIIENQAGNEGGGLWLSQGDALQVLDSQIEGNRSPNGGGLFMDIIGIGGNVSIERSAFVRNVAESGGNGGAIDSEGGTLGLRNSTLSNNLAENGGGLNADPGTQLLLEFTTIAGNIASNQGGGLRVSAGRVNSSLIGDNQAFVGPDGFGSLDDVAYSLVSNTAGLAIGNSSFNFLNFDPLLLPLTNNGGPSETHGLMPASLAVGNADQVNCPATDQRGALRTDACDIGAYEIAPLSDEIFRDGFED